MDESTWKGALLQEIMHLKGAALEREVCEPFRMVDDTWLEHHLRHELLSVNTKLDKILEHAEAAATRSSQRSAGKSTQQQPRRRRGSITSVGSNLSVLSGLELVLSPLSSPPGRRPGLGLGQSVESTRSSNKESVRGSKKEPARSSGKEPARSSSKEPARSSPKAAGSPKAAEPLQTSCTSSTSGLQAAFRAAAAKPSLNRSHSMVVQTAGEEDEQTFRSRMATKNIEAMEATRVLSLITGRNSVCETAIQRTWEFLEVPESGYWAWFFATIWPAFILASVALTLAQSLRDLPFNGLPAAILETVVDSVFLLEVIVRFVCCPKRWAFLSSPYNLIDLLAAAPLAVRASIGLVLPEGEVDSVPHAILLCGVPIARLLKTLRRFEKFQLLLNAFRLAVEALPVMLFILSIVALTFAMLIYLAEPRDNIPSIPMSLWLTVVTMSTVGYGDMTPKSTLGHVITGVLIVVTALYMAIPLGIIGNAFSVTWAARDKILLMQHTRDRLQQRGFTAHDIPALFNLAAAGEGGELDIKDFRKLLLRMKIGFSEERILKLFQSFDTDNSGTVDDREFVRHLFPNSYTEIYEDDDSSEELDTMSECGGNDGEGIASGSLGRDLPASSSFDDENNTACAL